MLPKRGGSGRGRSPPPPWPHPAGDGAAVGVPAADVLDPGAERRLGELRPPPHSGCRDVAAAAVMAGDTEGVPPLDCVICFSPYDRLFKVPKILGCGHTFCLECLARVTVVAPAAPTLLCPVCRRPTPLPRRRGPPALPTRADLLALLPPGPTGSVRFSRPKGLLYVPPEHPKSSGHPKFPDQVPTVTLSLELGRPEPPVPPNRGRSWISGRWSLYRTVALTVALMVGGGLVLCGVFVFFLQPVAWGEGGPVTNSTWGEPSWPPY